MKIGSGFSLLSAWILSTVSGIAHPAIAQCVQADVSVQYNISGSKEPTERSNDVDFQSSPNCSGNVSVTTGVQGNEGGNGRVRQTRIVRHRFENNSNNSDRPGGKTIQIQSNPTIDVYNAADNLD
ncbi:MAG: hypothetical protein ACFCU5_10220 [Pleurocapsa sp.]